jgi:hypothetical protein
MMQKEFNLNWLKKTLVNTTSVLLF